MDIYSYLRSDHYHSITRRDRFIGLCFFSKVFLLLSNFIFLFRTLRRWRKRKRPSVHGTVRRRRTEPYWLRENRQSPSRPRRCIYPLLSPNRSLHKYLTEAGGHSGSCNLIISDKFRFIKHFLIIPPVERTNQYGRGAILHSNLNCFYAGIYSHDNPA